MNSTEIMLDPGALCGTLIDSRYLLQEFLGSGAFGAVFCADEIALGESVGSVAVKLIRPQNDAHRLAVLHEIRAMASLSHPHLLAYRSAGETAFPHGETLIFLALELAENSLENVLQSGRMTNANIDEMALRIAGALCYLQERGIVHRDLKPGNVLRVGGEWKIADFGLARATAQTLHQTAAAGTLAYMSPDAIDGEIAPAGDVWAFGVLLQECLTGRFPYPDAPQIAFIRNVAQSEPFIAPAMPPPYDEIVRGCLVKDPKLRWTAARVLATLQARPRQKLTPVVAVAPASVAPAPVASAPQDTVVLPRQSSEPVVDAAGNGTHRTIGEALKTLPRAARIWVKPGVYRESLLLDFNIEIIGEGGRENVVIECGSGNCLKVTAGASLVRGVTLRGVARSMSKRYHAVSVSGGALTLDDCLVSSDSLACVATQNAGVNTRVRGCLIENGANDGLLFSGGASGEIERCRVAGHARHGLHIKDGAAPSASDCAFNGNGGSGVFCEQGGGTLQNCEIVSNRKTGVHIGADSALTLRDCSITENRQQAISAERGASGTIENCDLRDNVFGAWAVSSSSALVRRNNREGG